MSRKRVAWSVTFLTLLAAASIDRSASAGYIFHIVVDTSSITAGTPGSLEMQYNPAMTLTTVGTAVVTNFVSRGGGASATPTPEVHDAVTGDLTRPSTTFTASTAWNDILQNFTYGSGFSFDLTLNGPNVPSDRFSLTLWSGNIAAVDGGMASQLLTSDPSGAALLIDFNGQKGSVAYASPQVTASVVPEPSSLILLATACPGLLIAGRKWRRGPAA